MANDLPTRTPREASPPVAVKAVRAVARLSRQLERVTDELSLAQYRVLGAVAAGDSRASRLAAKLALGKPTVSGTIDTLTRRGLVIRSAVQGDQRAADLVLSPEGRAVLDRVESAMVARLEELCRSIGDGVAVLNALTALGVVMESEARDR